MSVTAPNFVIHGIVRRIFTVELAVHNDQSYGVGGLYVVLGPTLSVARGRSRDGPACIFRLSCRFNFFSL